MLDVTVNCTCQVIILIVLVQVFCQYSFIHIYRFCLWKLSWFRRYLVNVSATWFCEEQNVNSMIKLLSHKNVRHSCVCSNTHIISSCNELCIKYRVGIFRFYKDHDITLKFSSMKPVLLQNVVGVLYWWLELSFTILSESLYSFIYLVWD